MVDVAEFDLIADEYDKQHRANIAVTGEGPEYFAEYKIRVLRELLTGNIDKIIDFGSGTGNSVPFFQKYFPESQLTGVDVSQRSLDIAAERFPGTFGIKIESNHIPILDDRFDAAFSACVFHHINHDEHIQWLGELRRVVRPGGHLAIFEHNPLNPLTLHAVNTCPFDINARLIRAGQLAERYRAAGWRNIQIRYHIFFPRALAALRPAEARLGWLPLGAQYSILAEK